MVDVSPLRRSRQYRLLWFGQLVSIFGTQLTTVAVPYQVYRLTHSSLQVGLVSLGQLGPLLIGSLAGGAIVDAHDRRRVLLGTQALLLLTSACLVLNASLGQPRVWPLYLITAASAGVSGVDWPARISVVPTLIDGHDLPSAMALWQILIQLGSVVGPAAGGLLLARTGFGFAYGFDAATFLVGIGTVGLMRPLPPRHGGTAAGLRSITDGLRFLRRDRLILGTFVIDLNAMVFGMPRAVFPAMAVSVYHGGAGTVGLLNAAPGAGALAGSVLTGWVPRVRRQGRAVVVAVVCWGASIALFGISPTIWLGLACLALAGASDVVSAVFRNTILQATVPDELRGRASATFIAVVTGGPRLGDAETGTAAAIGGPRFAVWSGGLASIAGGLLVAWRFPALMRYDRGGRSPAPEPEPEPLA